MRALRRSCSVLALLFLFVLAARPAAAVTVEQIPSPRPTGWAVDQSGVLPMETLAELNRLGDEVKGRTGAELAVAVVATTGGDDPHEFATRLFHAWKIGRREKDDGILVFVAVADRKAEIVLGHGLDTESGRRASEAVMQGTMVPRFRIGDPTDAVLQGALACARQILDVQPSSEVMQTAPVPVSPIPIPLETPVPNTPAPVQEPTTSGRTDGFWWGTLGVLLLLGAVLLLRPVRCPRCRKKMLRLDKKEESAYLVETERLEERIGSVDHKVWLCPACGEVKKRASVRSFSGYKRCPQCSVQTLSFTTSTVEEATYTHDGLEQTDEKCVNCSYENSFTRSIPQLVERQTRDDDSSSSSPSAVATMAFVASSSSSDSGSSSAGSDSGFGGGDSSGGGASGSW